MRVYVFTWPRPPDVLTVLGEIEQQSRRYVVITGYPIIRGHPDLAKRASWMVARKGIVAEVPARLYLAR